MGGFYQKTEGNEAEFFSHVFFKLILKGIK